MLDNFHGEFEIGLSMLESFQQGVRDVVWREQQPGSSIALLRVASDKLQALPPRQVRVEINERGVRPAEADLVGGVPKL